MRVIPFAAAFCIVATAALAQGVPGTTGGAAGSIGGATTAPAGTNGDAAMPAPATGATMSKARRHKTKHGSRKKHARMQAPASSGETTTSTTYGGTQDPGH